MIYEVKYGDCLSGIALKKQVSVKEIRELNPNIRKDGSIVVGQKIILPDDENDFLGLDSVQLNNTNGANSQTNPVLSPEKIKERKFLREMKNFIDIPSARVFIHKNKQNRPFLKISRPLDSKAEEDNYYQFGNIKKKLKLHDDVLYSNNGEFLGLLKTADRMCGDYIRNFDTLSIAPGHYLYIPLSGIGQKQEVKKGFIFNDYYDSPLNTALKKAVSDFLN